MPGSSRRLRLWDSHRLIRFDLGVQKAEPTSTTPVRERSKNVPLNSVKTRSTVLDFLVTSSTRGMSWQKGHCCPAKISGGHSNPLKISMITHGRSRNDLN